MIFIGIDFGTSGCRAIAIDQTEQIVAQVAIPLPAPVVVDNRIEQDPQIWWQALEQLVPALLQQLSAQERAEIQSICVNGTSATLLLTDADGNPLTPALMYNDSRAVQESTQIAAIVPETSGAHGATSSLSKLLWLLAHIDDTTWEQAAHALHQADWISNKLTGKFGFSDENNALKLGYDVIQRKWPDWLQELSVPTEILPAVQPPGTDYGAISPQLAQQWEVPQTTQIVAGTTDSIAATLAAGVSQPGDAVTSLGSTLVLKMLVEQPVFAPEQGIYSHRLGDLWLVGGASNAGGAVLKKYFSPEEIAQFSAQLNPAQPTGLDYYPLLAPGERFPICDPQLQPHLTPRPAEKAQFFQAILEGLTRIEQQGYEKIIELSGTPLRQVRTAGGGAKNEKWRQMREQILAVPVLEARNREAAFGSALLAKQGV